MNVIPIYRDCLLHRKCNIGIYKIAYKFGNENGERFCPCKDCIVNTKCNFKDGGACGMRSNFFIFCIRMSNEYITEKIFCKKF